MHSMCYRMGHLVVKIKLKRGGGDKPRWVCHELVRRVCQLKGDQSACNYEVVNGHIISKSIVELSNWLRTCIYINIRISFCNGCIKQINTSFTRRLTILLSNTQEIYLFTNFLSTCDASRVAGLNQILDKQFLHAPSQIICMLYFKTSHYAC